MTNKELEMVIEIKEAELAGLKAKLEGCEDQKEEVKRPARGKKAAKAKSEPEVEEEAPADNGGEDDILSQLAFPMGDSSNDED